MCSWSSTATPRRAPRRGSNRRGRPFPADSARPACYNRRMTKKPPKPGMEESEAQYKPQDDDMVEFSDEYWDAWFERNAEALNASIREARKGPFHPIDEVMARVMANINRVAKKD